MKHVSCSLANAVSFRCGGELALAAPRDLAQSGISPMREGPSSEIVLNEHPGFLST